MPPIEAIARFIVAAAFGLFGVYCLGGIYAIVRVSFGFGWETTGKITLGILTVLAPCAFYIAWLFWPFTISIS